jgi:hypothetical protein
MDSLYTLHGDDAATLIEKARQMRAQALRDGIRRIFHRR